MVVKSFRASMSEEQSSARSVEFFILFLPTSTLLPLTSYLLPLTSCLLSPASCFLSPVSCLLAQKNLIFMKIRLGVL
ncbi:hypothetical protein D5R40_21965 [Okeania hirsuta]|uniref:Uncharacterized protein n=1 Tax=Okeania hirsuta TaxID=1458930 RepID=A0A3N6PNK9_9CYAN|nr:hypothetical protein D5R40_21965 [Okeania hirsuta]